LRRPTTKAVKVQPGDQIIVRAALPHDSNLARLYVWAKEFGSDDFSPYVRNTDVISTNGMPQMLSPLSMRLVSNRHKHTISFVSDIKGQIVIVQEVDTGEDKLAKVELDLVMADSSRLDRFKRRLIEWPRTVRL
jgi:hypothetical protein